MRILVTNDDGIDSVGLHVLARALKSIGDVVIGAPDREYSGFGAALGSFSEMKPEMRRVTVPGVDEAWTVDGPPALCAMFARLGLFGEIDLLVSGINPGANVGRSIYHSGTVGAALTARNGGINAVAVSQSVEDWGVEGQGWDAMLEAQDWQSAADVATVMIAGLAADLPDDPVLLNINVPNTSIPEMSGWRRTSVGTLPPRTVTEAVLEAKPGHEGTFSVKMSWGDAVEVPVDSDAGAVMAGYVSLSWLGRIDDTSIETTQSAAVESALDSLLG